MHTAGNGRLVGLGVSQQQFQLDPAEIQRLTTSGLSIGGMTSGSIYVGGITSVNSATVTGVVSMAAISDDSQVIFSSQEAAFNQVGIQADNGIILTKDLITATGDLTLNGDYDNSSTGDDHNKIVVSGDRILQAQALLTVEAQSGGIERTGVGTLKLIGGDGVYINNDVVSLTPNQPIEIQSDLNADGGGTATVKPGRTINSANGKIFITAADLDLGNLNSGSATVTISVSKQDLSIGLGLTSKDLTVTGPELQGITSTGLIVGGTVNSDLIVHGVEAANVAAITEVVTLLAVAAAKVITFTTTPSTFNQLSVQAGNGVNLNAGITTVVGDLLIDGDSNNLQTGISGDKIIIANGKTLFGYERLTLQSQSGGIFHSALTLKARNGVVINDNMSGQNAGRALMINADQDSDGTGAFTVKAGIAMTSLDSEISITAADIDVLGALSSGTEGISLHASGMDRTIGLGASTATQQMHLGDSEMANIVSGVLTIGNQHNADLIVEQIEDSSNANIGSLNIVALKSTRTVTFTSAPSFFNKGISVQAMGGVTLSQSVVTKSSQTTLRAGTGTLTIMSTKSLSTTNQDLFMTSDDFDIQTGVMLDAGTGVVTVGTETARTVGAGTNTEQMNLDLLEIQRIQARGLTVGGGVSASLSVLVEGVTSDASSGIFEFVKFVAAIDDSKVTFAGSASTFSALGAQADNGITVDSTIIATTGYMHLDGDMDRDNKGDSDNSIRFADAMTVQAKTYLTLEALT